MISIKQLFQLQKRLPKWIQRSVTNSFKTTGFLFVCLFFVCLFVFVFCFVLFWFWVFFVKKLNISCSLDHTILVKFHQHVVQIIIK